MANTQTLKEKKKTIKQLHEAVKQLPIDRKNAVITALGGNPKASDQIFYDVMSGRRKLSPAEKKAISEIYGVAVENINWQDQKKLIA